MDAAQLRTPLYWPGGEFMYLVLTTSTGEAMMVVHSPAPKADTKWQGRLSAGGAQVGGVWFGTAVWRVSRGPLPHLSGEWTWAARPWSNRRSPALCNLQSRFSQCLEQFLRDKVGVTTKQRKKEQRMAPVNSKSGPVHLSRAQAGLPPERWSCKHGWCCGSAWPLQQIWPAPGNAL